MDTLIDRIWLAMSTDDEDRDKQSQYLEDEYNKASEESKKAIDMCFIALCGWSLKTMLERQEK